MQLHFLKAKIHRATVTAKELDYEGSCAIDENLLRVAGIAEFEKIEIYNLANGNRISTYAIIAPAASGTIAMNGAAAHRAQVGEQIIICCYCQLTEEQAQQHQPTIVHVDKDNRLISK